MNYSSDEKGIGTLTLTPLENKLLREGKTIFHSGADSDGVYTILVKITRPRSRARRFPESIYGKKSSPSVSTLAVMNS